MPPIEVHLTTTAFVEDAAPRPHRVRVADDGAIDVYDPVLETWNANHAMPAGAQLAARRLVRWLTDADGPGPAVLQARSYRTVEA